MLQSTFSELGILSTAALGTLTGASSFVPANPALAVLAFLAAVAGLLAGAGGFVVCIALRRKTLARRIASITLAGASIYLAGLFATGIASRDQALPPGARKYFCEIDCHLAYRVLPESPAAGAARCRDGLRVVRVETWFDPSTVATFRGNAPLTPNPRRAFLLDQAGRRYAVSDEAARACAEDVRGSVPFTRALRPGESYRTALAFSVPADRRGLRLWLGDPTPGVEQFLAGHENSFFHSKVYFEVP